MQLPKSLIIITLLIISTSILSFSQHEIGFFYSPNLAFRSISEKIDYSDGSYSEYKPLYGQIIGLNVGYTLKSCLTFKTGINYATKGYHKFDHSQNEYGSASRNQKYIYRYLEFPISLRFKSHMERKMNYTIESGIAYNKYMNTKLIERRTNPDKSFSYTLDLEHFYPARFSIFIQSGIHYRLYKKIIFYPSIYSEFMIYKLNEDNTYPDLIRKWNLYNLGLKFEFLYSF